MSTLACPGHDLLLLLEFDPHTGGGSELAQVRAHVEGCAACQASAGFLAEALAAPSLPFDPCADSELAALKERLDSAPPPTTTSRLENVRLLCTYCKDGLPPAETIYCAACLAPHHGECFAEHGSCAAPGCAGHAVVRTTDAPTPRPRRGRIGPFVLGAVLCGGAVAALWPEAGDPRPEATLGEAPLPTRSVSHTVVAYPLDGLFGVAQDAELDDLRPKWQQEVERRLSAQSVTLNFTDTPLAEVVGFLQDITGLNIVLDASIDPEETTISLRLRDIALGDALDIILEQAGLDRRLQNETLLIVPRDQRPVRNEPAVWPLPLQSARGVEPRVGALIEDLRGHVERTLGEGAWEAPASIDLGASRLIVSQTAAGHEAVELYLASRRGREGLTVPGELQDAWFAPGRGFHTPSSQRARRIAKAIQEKTVSVNFEQTPFAEVLSFMKDITGIDVRLAPTARELVDGEATAVSLRLKDITLKNALNLIVASHERLVWDVDRRGVLVRTFSTPTLAARLDESQSTLEGFDARELRRRLAQQQVSLNFHGTPLEEGIDFLRDITGLNFVVAADVPRQVKITVRLKDLSLANALEMILAGSGLGWSISDGVIKVVPRARASERPELRKQLEGLAKKALCEEALLGIDLGELAGRLEQATGAEVVLTARAGASRARIALPAGCTVEAALALATQQASLNTDWTWLRPEWSPVLVVDAADRGALVEAMARSVQASEWPQAPASAREALASAQARALAALRALREPGNMRELLERVEAVITADEVQQDLLRGHLALGPRGMEAARAGADGAERIFAEQLEKGVRQRELQGVRELTHRAQESELEHARGRLSKLEAGAAGYAEAKARVEAVLQDMARGTRDSALEEARLHSERAALTQRLRDLRTLPSLEHRLEAKRAALEGGATWEAVFPAGFIAWRHELGEGYARAASALHLGRLDLQVAQAGRLVIVEWSPEGSPLRPRDVICAVNGEPVSSRLGLYELLAASKQPRLTVERRGGELTVELPASEGR